MIVNCELHAFHSNYRSFSASVKPHKLADHKKLFLLLFESQSPGQLVYGEPLEVGYLSLDLGVEESTVRDVVDNI